MTEEELQQHFDEFFEDIFLELEEKVLLVCLLSFVCTMVVCNFVVFVVFVYLFASIFVCVYCLCLLVIYFYCLLCVCVHVCMFVVC